MKLGRRSLMTASLGAAQMALLSKSNLARAQDAGAGANGPTKLLTIFLPGGWMSPFALVPWSAAEIASAIPAPFQEYNEPIYFTGAQVQNLDGTTTPGRIRVPVLWDAAELSQGRPDRRMGTSPHGWSWKQHQLWNNACIVHGVDQGTVAHAGGQMSALCGVASSELKAPTLNAVVADRLFARFPDRPVPSVWIGGPAPGQLTLRSEAAPAHLTSQANVNQLLSDRLQRPWGGLRARDVNSTVAPQAFDGSPIPNAGFVINPLEARSLKRMRELRGTINPSSEAMVEQLHDSLLSVSRLLARDVATAVQRTNGVEHTPAPFWAPTTGNHFGVTLGNLFQDSGSRWSSDFDIALKLLKADVCSAVAVGASGATNWSFDAGHAEGHRRTFIQARGIFDIIGRLLGEMKATPRPNGRTLLDETLVVVLSDFARTMPHFSVSSDHWAANTVIFAGGGLQTNKAVGGYSIPNRPATDIQGHDSAPTQIREGASMLMRPPRSADVVTTALEVLGLPGHRITGGNGEIVGVRI